MDSILKAIDRAYKKEPFRIKDIINSVNDNQTASKEWLIKHFKPVGKTVILGGWYGYLANHFNAISVDLDQGCKDYGKIMYPSVRFVVDDAFNFVMKHKINTIICTGCEHMPQNDLKMLTELPNNPLLCLQSNNYSAIEEHINCKESLEEFVSEYNLSEVMYAGELNLGKYKRWMLCGRVK